MWGLHDRTFEPPANIAQVFSIFSHRAGTEIVRERITRQIQLSLCEKEGLLAQVRVQAQRVQQIVDTIPDGVLMLKVNGDGSGRLLLANPTASEYLGILAGANVQDMRKQSSLWPGSGWMERDGSILICLGDRPLAELLAPSPDGLWVWHELLANRSIARQFELVARLVNSSSGGWVMVIRDVTRERVIQQRIQHQ
jgi:PAS domain-containing protein